MINNRSNYEAQLAEAREDGEEEQLFNFRERQHLEALASYPEGCDEELYRYCTICGALLKYRSMAYDEGFHFDSCL